MTEVGDSAVVANMRVRAQVKGTDSEMFIDYSQVFWIADGKITRIRSASTTRPSPMPRPPSAQAPRAKRRGPTLSVAVAVPLRATSDT